MWHEALYGFAIGVAPAIISGLLIQRYSMYLAKLGRSRLNVALTSLFLMTLLTFSFVCVIAFLVVLVLKPEVRPWMEKGGLLGTSACLFLVWLRLCVKLVRYQASYFIEYTYPRQTVIRGVPLLVCCVFALAFWRSGLIEVGAEWLAHKSHNPAFCRASKDKDHCQEQFYVPELLKGAKVDPAICRGLSGSHVVKCLIAHHPEQPDVVHCKSLRDREGEDSSVYYWCLGFLPKARETQEACRRAESSSHWVNMFYGNCLKEANVNDRTESGKTVVMQLLDVKYQSAQPAGLKKLGVKYPISIHADLASLLAEGLDLDKVDRDGRNLLFYVHDLADLQALLEHGIKVNHPDQNGLTAPMVWMGEPQPSLFRPHMDLVAKKGLQLNMGDKKGRTVLTHLILSLKPQSDEEKNSPDNVALVETLLRLGANPYLRDKAKKRPVDYAKEFGLNQISATLRNFRDYQTGAPM